MKPDLTIQLHMHRLTWQLKAIQTGLSITIDLLEKAKVICPQCGNRLFEKYRTERHNLMVCPTCDYSEFHPSEVPEAKDPTAT